MAPLLALLRAGRRRDGRHRPARRRARDRGWALSEMRAPGGGFYAALDADSEGHEGRFYVWQRDEVERLLEPAEYRVLARRFGLDREANFEGAWHLHAFVAMDAVAEQLSLTRADADALLAAARAKLFDARSKRVRPGLDDKVLTAWNALMIRGPGHRRAPAR